MSHDTATNIMLVMLFLMLICLPIGLMASVVLPLVRSFRDCMDRIRTHRENKRIQMLLLERHGLTTEDIRNVVARMVELGMWLEGGFVPVNHLLKPGMYVDGKFVMIPEPLAEEEV